MFSSRTTLVAALCAAGLLSGCGAASSNAPASNATTPTTTSPGQGQFNPGLVPSVTTSTTSTTTTTKAKTKPKGATKKTRRGSGRARSSAHTGSSGGSGTGGAAVSSGGGGGHTVTVTRTVTVTKTRTLTRYRNHTVVVAPNVPSGAHMPSSLPALGFSRFAADGGNIGCALGGGVVRCDIATRVWSPPGRPRSCGYDWGQGLTVGPSGPGHFVCAGDSVLDPTGPVVTAGRDDRVGSVTCQVRSFGVTCFDTAGNGFFISRTGYDTF